ncbi:hypothetical protein HTV80_00490 [Streptomyces sp. Vc74B-19]|uniref:hypothetical protein n=1 Tax=unclassified Streptomyces TaxID=2593676 RepID=UPI001BFC446B|nr:MULTISPECIES: hypothetical protein [unclassified Streptomyces]MBT3161593.1 hypothetical protein [Streptomyces sp. Vc74B-19]MCO4695899.1 hypothetical protein [Streptomyces sp. RO-S4]MDU0302851.1 hypothetical protein [Streptomyces sp. PAL114]
MSPLIDAVPGLLSAIGAAAVIALASAAWRRLSSRRSPASAALAASQDAPPLPAHPRPGRRPGAVRDAPARRRRHHRVGGRPQRFALTDVPLGEGTFAAESFGHL